LWCGGYLVVQGAENVKVPVHGKFAGKFQSNNWGNNNGEVLDNG